MTDTKPTLGDLLEQYWEIAFSEGKTGVSRGDKAHAVLYQIKELTRIQSAEMPEPPYIPQLREYLSKVTSEITHSSCGIGNLRDVVNYIDALKACAQRMSKEASAAVHLNDEQAQRVYTAERELAECRKDADRYRWLRDLSHSTPLGVYEWVMRDGRQQRAWLASYELDAAIDAAIAKESDNG
jgi:hypothetical protein